MFLNCYYYAPHNHTLLVEHLDADLERMVGLGTHAVSLCVAESQLTNWHRPRLQRVLERIHAHGLKAHAVPNRWAGLVAGWFDGFGKFTIEHRDTLIRNADGSLRIGGEMVSCVNNPVVREHIRLSIKQLFTELAFDGLVWDEPHSDVCHCSHCTALEPHPTNAWHHGRTAAFIDEMSAYAKTINPHAMISLFVQPHQGDLLRALLATRHIDFLGSDGHIRATDHVMHRMKGTIFQAHAEFFPLLQQAKKPTFFLLEAQRHRDEDLANYLQHVDQAFALPMDHLMWYYSAHEMLSAKNEAAFNAATWAAVRRRAAGATR